ncbi:PREDICTED: synaptotagmin-4 [Polistes canadensis]|uniref:synaptotagmin-4 n=1 Tax=Polistes canadensis TaxID=91411 RepID=UPI000718D880|nr:PREDICTED: synaptotagmin-4 [Polistes canadensis]
MAQGDTEDGPLIRPVNAVSTRTLIALCTGGAFLVCAVAMTWWLCRRRREHTKLNADRSLAFRPPHRKPTAVKSPGSTSHYLKKSPSPTGPAKNPPGSTGGQQQQTSSSPAGGSTNTISDLATPQTIVKNNNPNYDVSRCEKAGTPVETFSTEVTLTIEDECDKAELENNEKVKCESNLCMSDKKNGLGILVFKLRYKSEQNALAVTVVKCKKLPARDQGNASSDPYVKLQLLPGKRHHVKTRVLRNTRNPVYNEDFTFFGITKSQLEEISLHFVVLSFDRYSRDEIIGELTCALSSIPGLKDSDNQEISLRRNICPRSLKIQSQGRGELLVSFCWQSQTNQLSVIILKARDLPKMDVTGLVDPYVKIYLFYESKRISKRKTHVKKRTLSPVFNEPFVFDIPKNSHSLSNVSLEIILYAWDKFTKSEVIGRLKFGGSKGQGSALNHWNNICRSPQRQFAEWHKLRE